jgi:endonuclease/exonuclease/phosphatase family metal-dependent hydrolase
VRAVTFNIRHGVGVDRRLDLRRVARAIERLRADVVGLQEVDQHWSDRSDFADQPALLGEWLGMYAVLGATLDLDPPAPDRPRRRYGNALLSRAPVLDWSNIFLPREEGDEQRALLRARTAVSEGVVDVYVTHLQHDPASARLAQATVVAETIAAGEGSRLLLADVNGTPDTPEARALTDRLVDVWAVVGWGAGHTFPALWPTRRIDVVLCSANVRPVAARVPLTIASDHRPVLAEVAPEVLAGVGGSAA